MAKPSERASDDEIRAAAKTILAARYVMALTGAGMSVESGIPPFRGPGGLWTKYGEPPMNGYQIFLADPKKAWEERLSKRNDELYKPLSIAKPNPGHLALVDLEAVGSAALCDHPECRRPASTGRAKGTRGNSWQLDVDSMPQLPDAVSWRRD